MFSLGLAPLPVNRNESNIAPESSGWEDFVPQDALREVTAGACRGRLTVSPMELELSSSDDDFASVAMVARPAFIPISWPEPPAAQAPAVFKPVYGGRGVRAAPPAVPQWDVRGVSHRRGYRWWVPGMVGVAATFVLAAVLFLFSQQTVVPNGAFERQVPPLWVKPSEPVIDPTLQTPEPVAKDPSMVFADWITP